MRHCKSINIGLIQLTRLIAEAECRGLIAEAGCQGQVVTSEREKIKGNGEREKTPMGKDGRGSSRREQRVYRVMKSDGESSIALSD
jgi:hypothetical protein